MRKRSAHVSLAILGAAAFGLAGCKSQETDASAFPDEASCVAAADQGSLFFTAEDCKTAFAEAQQNHLETAPRYDSLAVCEEQHGVGNCGGDPAAQQSGGGMGSIFMPLMMGYLLGSALGGSRGVMSQPLSRTANGGFATPSGDTRLATNNGTGKMQAGAFTKAPTTMGQPPMSRAQVAQRGGFGQTATSRSGGARVGG
ncbi:DUF1190 domain-containing protein [uncultured Paracoccus sp.]|uniref:DUF1190 domain-containing protein n=1 Tax=uncultured Paracoccus sp. TaxID=189685 RepID=UPI002639944B|nr:DUF1190 domain-containing protein [uncultured Paracoccus sp.]